MVQKSGYNQLIFGKYPITYLYTCFFTSQVVIAGFLPSTVVTGRVDDTSSFYCGLRECTSRCGGPQPPPAYAKTEVLVRSWLVDGWNFRHALKHCAVNPKKISAATRSDSERTLNGSNVLSVNMPKWPSLVFFVGGKLATHPCIWHTQHFLEITIIFVVGSRWFTGFDPEKFPYIALPLGESPAR